MTSAEGSIFGDHVEAAATTEPAAWIDGARRSGWSVGSLVPNDYPVVLRVHAPDPEVEDWWAACRSVWEAVATAGAAHTSTPGRAWFGVWEGNGWANVSTRVASRTPLEGSARVARWSMSGHACATRMPAATPRSAPSWPCWRTSSCLIARTSC